MNVLTKQIAVLMIFLGVAMSGCADTVTWREEVKLSDGRVIEVMQRRRYEGVYTGQDVGSVVREAWLSFRLPEFGNQEITWHENLKPRILNLSNNKWYVVGIPPTGLEFAQYGKPKPDYVGFRYEGEKWLRIPFEEIPEEIYSTNLWIENVPPNKSSYVSVADKTEEMRKPTLSNYHKKVNRNSQSNFH